MSAIYCSGFIVTKTKYSSLLTAFCSSLKRCVQGLTCSLESQSKMKPLDENVNLSFIRQKAIKIAITEIKAVKLCRNYNLKDLLSE